MKRVGQLFLLNGGRRRFLAIFPSLPAVSKAGIKSGITIISITFELLICLVFHIRFFVALIQIFRYSFVAASLQFLNFVLIEFEQHAEVELEARFSEDCYRYIRSVIRFDCTVFDFYSTIYLIRCSRSLSLCLLFQNFDQNRAVLCSEIPTGVSHFLTTLVGHFLD